MNLSRDISRNTCRTIDNWHHLSTGPGGLKAQIGSSTMSVSVPLPLFFSTCKGYSVVCCAKIPQTISCIFVIYNTNHQQVIQLVTCIPHTRVCCIPQICHLYYASNRLISTANNCPREDTTLIVTSQKMCTFEYLVVYLFFGDLFRDR